MPNSTTIAEAVTALSGPGVSSGDAAGGTGNAEGVVGAAEGGGFKDLGHDSAPCWPVENADPEDDQDAHGAWTETTEPRLIPKIFPVYAFI
jgi:hypothetical protein